jgi:drug/metabolite transporter (DMT)-like permease
VVYLGLFPTAIAFTTYAYALRHMTASSLGVTTYLVPPITIVMAWLFLGERFTLWLGIGLALAFAGVALISLAQPNGQNELVGVLLCLLAALVYSISLVVQKPLVSRLSALHVTWIACTIGAVVCLPFARRLVDDTQHASASDIGWVVYLGLFPTAIAFTTYAYALRHMTASSLGVTTYLVPPITIVMAWLFLGEVPPAMAFVGGALALVGVAVARHRPRVPEVVPEPA